MYSPRLVVAAVALALLGACKGGGGFTDASVPDDASPIDAIGTIDAAPPAPGREITSGGGRVQGQQYILDVQVGHGVVQRPARGADVVVEGNSPVKR
jgi:hypothetical protein